jgi:OmpA-OmpF porin, OOP family
MKNLTKAAIIAVVLLVASSARAQLVPNFDLERLSLDPAAVSSMVIGTGEILPEGQSRVFLAAHYENRPLVLLTDGEVVGRGLSTSGTRVGDIVGNRVTAHLGGAVSVLKVLELNVKVPVVAWQNATKNLNGVGALASSGLASPSMGAKLKMVDQEAAGVNAALALDIVTPWGTSAAVAGNSQWTFAPRVEVGHRFDAVVVGAEAGMYIREHELSFNGRTLGTEARGGVVVASTGTLRGEISVRGAYSKYTNSQSMEALAGVRYAIKSFEVFALGGPGFMNEPGTPTYRGVVGIAYAPQPAKAAPPPPPPPVVKVDPCAPGQTHTPDQCPDLDDDGDGIRNADDACPLVAGIPENKGCPDVDTDGDGIPDRLDKCPTVKGIPENQGCPDVDTDGDGIPDRLDKCPTVPGVPENDGCPPEKAKLNLETKKIDILDMVYFDTSKATIQERSYSLLDDVAKVLADHAEVATVRVEGHTDNTGPAAFNTWLSDERAKAVKAYLIKKGIDAGRLEAKGYGPAKPIADNKTKEGREKNRRVEFVLP